MVPTSHKNVAHSAGTKDVQITSCHVLLSCFLKYSRVIALGRGRGREKNVTRQCIRQMSAYLDLLNYTFVNILRFKLRTLHQWRTEGGFGVFKPPPQNSEGRPKSCQTQPDCENC